MLIIREVLVARPGKASQLAGLFKKVFADHNGTRVLTDYTGDFNNVVLETEVDSVSEFEKRMKDYESGKMTKELDKETAELMKKYSDLYETGRREIFRVVE